MAPSPFTELTPLQQAQLLKLARQAVDAWVKDGDRLVIDYSQVDASLSKPGASFVSLHARGKLRGCIGTLIARQPLAADVAEHARAAASQDYRFSPVRPDELADIHIEISVLSAPVLLSVADEAELVQKLEPGVDGLVLDDGHRSATFLPLVWRQLPEPVQFVRYLKRKAGWPDNYWSADIRVQRYRSQSFHE